MPWKLLSDNPEKYLRFVDGVEVDWRNPSHLNGPELKSNWEACHKHQSYEEDGVLRGQLPFEFKSDLDKSKPRKPDDKYARTLAAARAKPGYVEVSGDEDASNGGSDADSEAENEIIDAQPKGMKRPASSMVSPKAKKGKSNGKPSRIRSSEFVASSAEEGHSGSESEHATSPPKKKLKSDARPEARRRNQAPDTSASMGSVAAAGQERPVPIPVRKGKEKAADSNSESEVPFEFIRDVYDMQKPARH